MTLRKRRNACKSMKKCLSNDFHFPKGLQTMKDGFLIAAVSCFTVYNGPNMCQYCVTHISSSKALRCSSTSAKFSLLSRESIFTKLSRNPHTHYDASTFKAACNLWSLLSFWNVASQKCYFTSLFDVNLAITFRKNIIIQTNKTCSFGKGQQAIFFCFLHVNSAHKFDMMHTFQKLCRRNVSEQEISQSMFFLPRCFCFAWMSLLGIQRWITLRCDAVNATFTSQSRVLAIKTSH